jgi:hypothetical protein
MMVYWLAGAWAMVVCLALAVAVLEVRIADLERKWERLDDEAA